MDDFMQWVELVAKVAGALTVVVRLVQTLVEMRRSRRGNGETHRNTVT